MPGATRTGTDSAGGTELSPPQGTVYVNGALWTVKGTPVAGHGVPPHDAPVMVGSSGTVFAEGIAVCRSGDAASCGHTASGSGDVFAN